MSSVGERVRLVRTHFNLNQSEFAKELGVAQSHISRVESNTQDITKQDLMILNLKFCVNEDYIINGCSEMFIINNNSTNYVLFRLNHVMEESLSLVRTLIKKDTDIT